MGRGSRLKILGKIGVLQNFAKFIGKRQNQGVFFNKVAGWRSATLLRKRLKQRCFSANFAKFFRSLFYIGHIWASPSLWSKFLKSFQPRFSRMRSNMVSSASQITQYNCEPVFSHF